MKIKFIAALIILLFNVTASLAQSKKEIVTGTVVTTDGNRVEFISISLKGTTFGCLSDEYGKFEFEAPAGNYTLVLHSISVQHKELAITIKPGKNTFPNLTVMDNKNQLKEVLITAKSEARQQQEQAYAVGVIDVQKAYTTAAPLNKILNNVSSVRIREEGGTGSNFNFTLNGFSGNQVKFFLDGIPMDNFGSSFNLGSMSANMAERIEVYKGVLPISLGADALGGAVNIVSRKDANYLDASYSVGSFNTHKVSLNGAYTNLKTGFTVRANTFFNYSDNDYKVLAPIKELSSGQIVRNEWVKRFHDNYQSLGLKFETGIVNKPYADYLLVGMILSKNNKDEQTGITMESVYGERTSKGESFIPSIRYKKEDLFIDGLSVSLYGTYNTVNSFATDTTSHKYNWLGESAESSSKGELYYTDMELKDREWQVSGNLSYMINNHQSVTFNHLFKSLERKTHDKVDTDNESNKIPQNLKKNISGLGWMINYTKWNANIFTKLYNVNSATHKIVDQFQSTQRIEKVSEDKTNLGYGAAFTYFVLPQFQLKTSYELTYRLPECVEMFGNGLNYLANPDLKPESSNNFNLGAMFEQQFKQHTILLESNFIYRDSKDFIFFQPSGGTGMYKNLGKVLTKGIEGGVKYRWKDLLHAGANLTYQHIIDNQEIADKSDSYVTTSNKNIRYKKRLPNIPYFFGSANVGANFKNVGMKESELTIDYYTNYTKEYYLAFPGLGRPSSKNIIPQQVSHDIALGYAMQNGKYSVSVECTNLTDERVYDNYMLQKPGRAFNIKFRYFLK